MPTIRTVTGTVLNPDGSPMVNSRVLFVLRPGSYTDDGEFPFTDHGVLTDNLGEYETELWANEEGNVSSVYTGEYENGETFEFTVPVTGPSDIPTLRALFAGPTSPTFPLIQDYVDTHLGGRDLDDTLPVVAGQAYVFDGTTFVPEAVFTAAQAHAAFLTQAEGDALYFPLGGILPYAQLPNAGGTWNAGGGVVALTGSLNATGTVTATEFFGEFDASQLTGTLPPGTFPATLPASSGENLTNLNASQLTTGTIPDGRFPATLPAVSGANLTSLNASQVTSGNLAYAQLPTGTGTWNVGAGNTLTLNSVVSISGAAGTERLLTFQTAGVDRWRFVITSTAEGGANAGSNFNIRARADDGSILSTPMSIERSSGNVNFSSAVNVNGIFTTAVVAAIGISSLASVGLRVGNTTLTGSSQNGFISNPTFASDATATSAAVMGAPATANSTFTASAIVSFYALNPTKGAASTILTAYGLLVQAITSGSTNWAIFTQGTTPSSFGGAVTITGAATLSSTLAVTTGMAAGPGSSPTSSILDIMGASGGTTRLLRIGINGVTNGLTVTTDASNNLSLGFAGAVTLSGNVGVTGNVNITGAYQRSGTQVVGARKTGWATATGTATRTSYDTASVTTAQLAERVKALIDDLHGTAGHGLIGT